MFSFYIKVVTNNLKRKKELKRFVEETQKLNDSLDKCFIDINENIKDSEVSEKDNFTFAYPRGIQVQIVHKDYDIDHTITFPAEKIASTDFLLRENSRLLPYWVTRTKDRDGDDIEIYPMDFNVDFKDDVEKILEFLLEKSNVGRIYVYPALRSIKEITEGPIPVEVFMELLIEDKLYFDITYCVVKDSPKF